MDYLSFTFGATYIYINSFPEFFLTNYLCEELLQSISCIMSLWCVLDRLDPMCEERFNILHIYIYTHLTLILIEQTFSPFSTLQHGINQVLPNLTFWNLPGTATAAPLVNPRPSPIRVQERSPCPTLEPFLVEHHSSDSTESSSEEIRGPALAAHPHHLPTLMMHLLVMGRAHPHHPPRTELTPASPR
jgi:hypothetical protein